MTYSKSTHHTLHPSQQSPKLFKPTTTLTLIHGPLFLRIISSTLPSIQDAFDRFKQILGLEPKEDCT